MIGEVGALGGAILPNVMGFSKQYTGGFATGFVAYALFTGLVLGCLFLWQRKWVGTWVGPRGKVLEPGAAEPARSEKAKALDPVAI